MPTQREFCIYIIYANHTYILALLRFSISNDIYFQSNILNPRLHFTNTFFSYKDLSKRHDDPSNLVLVHHQLNPKPQLNRQ